MTKINKIDLYSYNIPLNKELLMLGNKVIDRKGLIIKYYNNNGDVSWGEISPFNGLHKDNVSSIINYITLNNIAQEIELFSSGKELKAPSLLIMAYEQILLSSHIIHKVLPYNNILICPLLTGTNEDIIASIDLINQNNINVIKIKMGRNNLYDDINLFNSIDHKLANNIKIRIDVNRAWSYGEASIFAKSINKSRIDYIEEPLSKPNDLIRYFSDYNIKYALDETIYQSNVFSNMLSYKGCSAFIIKPSLFGSLNNLNIIKHIADKHNINLVFSSAFETGYSLAYYIYLACIYSSQNIAHGFDTYKYFSYDILSTPLKFNNYKISVNNAINSMKTISEKNLNPVRKLL